MFGTCENWEWIETKVCADHNNDYSEVSMLHLLWSSPTSREWHNFQCLQSVTLTQISMSNLWHNNIKQLARASEKMRDVTLLHVHIRHRIAFNWLLNFETSIFIAKLKHFLLSICCKQNEQRQLVSPGVLLQYVYLSLFSFTSFAIQKSNIKQYVNVL